MYDYITQNLTAKNDDDVVLMADSYDLWLQQSPRALLRRFREFEDAKIVIGADQWCWPNDPRSVSPFLRTRSLRAQRSVRTAGMHEGAAIRRPCRSLWRVRPVFPPSLSNPFLRGSSVIFVCSDPPRFANSGSVLGTLKHMRGFYEKLHSALAERPTMNDQGPSPSSSLC